MISLECVFFIDGILNFFLQPINEAGQVMYWSRQRISKAYFNDRFALDLFMILPHGIFMHFYKDLASFWMIKTLRIRDLIEYFSIKHNKYYINVIVNYK